MKQEIRVTDITDTDRIEWLMNQPNLLGLSRCRVGASTVWMQGMKKPQIGDVIESWHVYPRQLRDEIDRAIQEDVRREKG